MIPPPAIRSAPIALDAEDLRSDEVEWYFSRAARRGGHVADLSGSRSPCAEELARRGMCVWTADDPEDAAGAEQFRHRYGAAILPSGAFARLLTAESRTKVLRTARDVLKPRGLLLLDIDIVDPGRALAHPNFRCDTERYDTRRGAWISRQLRSVRLLAGRVIEYGFVVRIRTNGTHVEVFAPLRIVALPPIELIQTLESHGFGVVEAASDPRGTLFRLGAERLFVAAVAL
jgi:hypothetical protein